MYFDNYKHLDNEGDTLFTMKGLAKYIAQQNYGTHRMVCALVREQEKKCPGSNLSIELRKVVDKYVS